MKDIKVKLISNNTFEIDSCGVPQETDDLIINNQLLLVLDKELSISTFNKIRNLMQNGNVSLMSRCTLSRNQALCKDFTIK